MEQCKAFLQHKCNQHRPFTCFHWHFMNQRRRRPIKRRDGTLNYSPDVYCTLYDENTGICPNGDECPYLHRTAGDTERRYHLRYYKTSTCVYETDPRGYCVKNGPHCAFAHGPHDLRPPVYDIRELQGQQDDEDRLVSMLVGSLEREKGVLVDDLRWQESSFVLTYYKTEPCKRPPRLCRQGYACPFFHNNKDRRRSPKQYKYRSTPCPNVKLNDEWGDPSHCEQGDSCCYCHTRTEQQFHPEIYKSTKCNDVQQTGYCPRGPFCAFAHDEKELTAPRELTDEPMVTNPSPIVTTTTTDSDAALHSTSPYTKSLPQPIGRPPERTSSVSSDTFQRAPGAESYIRKQIQAIDADTSLDENERSRRKQNLLRLSYGSGAGMSPEATLQQSHSLPSSVSDALEAMVGGGLDDLTLEDIDTTSSNLTEEPSEVYSSGLLGQSPVAQGFMHSFQPQQLSTSFPYSTPLGPLSPYGPAGGSLPPSQRFPMSHMATGGPVQRVPASPTRPTPMYHAATGSPVDKSEVVALKDELRQTKSHLSQWHESWKQAKQACDAWKREAEEVGTRARREKEIATQRVEELESQLREAESQLHSQQLHGPVHTLAEGTDLAHLPLSRLEAIQRQLRSDLDRLDKDIRHRQATLCTQCKEFPRCVLTQPCQHCVLCESCADKLGKDANCPHCNEKITQRSTVILP